MAVAAGEKIHVATFDGPGADPVMVTVSMGACLVEPGDSIETVTEMADAALYMAKGEGRNRVMILDPPDRAEADVAAEQG